MENNQYNSLTEKLIQNGILSSNNEQKEKTIEELYDIKLDETMSNSPFVQKPIQETPLKTTKKRLNKYDLELLNGENIAQYEEQSNNIENSFKTLTRFLSFKQNTLQKGTINSFEKFLFRFFPRLYKFKLAKDAIKKLHELNIDTKLLFDKTIPYGEGEMRYQDLIKYIKYANEIQTKLNGKF